MLEIRACPFPASLQDAGRPGYRHLGVPLSGALDPEWQRLANALVGNPPAAACIEMRIAGPVLATDAETVFAIAGEVDARIRDSDGERKVSPWRGHRLHSGEQLRIASVTSGVAYLAFAGGIDSKTSLGSRATYTRAGLGEGVAMGGKLNVGAGGAASLLYLPQPPRYPATPLRLMPGPQLDHFTGDAWHALLHEEFEVSREVDRMGLRLLGPTLAHACPAAADIVSDAVTPGVIQVPGDGYPIVLLADCQTVGGYPKIAVVIGADLPRLAHLLPGGRLRFAAVTRVEALEARCQAAAELDRLIASLRPLDAGPDLDALYGANLIDGVIDAD